MGLLLLLSEHTDNPATGGGGLNRAQLNSLRLNSVPYIPPPSSIVTLTVDGEGTFTPVGWADEGGTFTNIQSDDGDTTRLYTPTVGSTRSLSFINSTAYVGKTINSVTLYAKVRSLDPVSNTVQLIYYDGTTVYTGATKDTNPATTYTLFSETWSVNPATGLAWTPAQVDAFQGGLKKINGPLGMGWTYSYLDVNYVVSAGATGQIKYYTGTVFTAKPIKVWNGTAWVVKPLKRYNGTAWVTTPY